MKARVERHTVCDRCEFARRQQFEFTVQLNVSSPQIRYSINKWNLNERKDISNHGACVCMCVFVCKRLPHASPFQHSPSTFQFLLFCARLIFNYFYFLYTCRLAYSELREAREQYHIYIDIHASNGVAFCVYAR